MENDNRIYDLLERLYMEMQDMKDNMATKDDIANMATKDDIANMATKDDIANMATKDDIANMVTKDDIANMATKDDINLLKDDIKLLGVELHGEIQVVYEEVKELRNDLNSMELLTTRNAYEIAKLKAVK